ncbi:hypothetical protein KP509_08G032800 [Ceratopteris richardii]|uniref:Uncharacterized protein n=1 Tax=Ceratopteris richardii TaxID=49495 RepID=A0A8T2U719_CERRI|nr:hypothetical protein KP509_08G032800 [Ceratopteris richardii]
MEGLCSRIESGGAGRASSCAALKHVDMQWLQMRTQKSAAGQLEIWKFEMETLQRLSQFLWSVNIQMWNSEKETLQRL